jgi:hypothetical protein
VVLLYSTVLKMMAIDMLHCDGYDFCLIWMEHAS